MKKVGSRGRWRAGIPVAALALFGMGCGGAGEPEPDPGSAWSPAGGSAAGAHNRPPLIEAVRLDPADPLPGTVVTAIVEVRDPDGDRVDTTFHWSIDERELFSEGPRIELPEVAPGAELTVVIGASDGESEAEPVSTSLTIGNRRPVLRSVALQPMGEVLPGQDAEATPIGEDPDGGELVYRYRWTVNDLAVEGSEATFSTAGLKPGDTLRVYVVASDGESESDEVPSGVLLVGNSPPRILSSPEAVGPGGVFRYQIEAEDPDGDRNLRYSLRKGPAGMSINPVLGQLTWTPRLEQAGVHPVEVVVEDSGGARAIQVFELSVAEQADATGQPPAAPE